MALMIMARSKRVTYITIHQTVKHTSSYLELVREDFACISLEEVVILEMGMVFSMLK